MAGWNGAVWRIGRRCGWISGSVAGWMFGRGSGWSSRGRSGDCGPFEPVQSLADGGLEIVQLIALASGEPGEPDTIGIPSIAAEAAGAAGASEASEASEFRAVAPKELEDSMEESRPPGGRTTGGGEPARLALPGAVGFRTFWLGPNGARDCGEGDQPIAVRDDRHLEVTPGSESDERYGNHHVGRGHSGSGLDQVGLGNHGGLLSGAVQRRLRRTWRFLSQTGFRGLFDRFPFGSHSRIRSGNVTPNGNRSAGYGRNFLA